MSKSGKSGKKDDLLAASFTLDSVSALLDHHREALATDFRASFSSLESKFDNIHSVVEDHGQRLSSLELVADDLSRRVGELENVYSGLSENNSNLMTRVMDLEGRSWWQNLRILGLAELIERPRPTEFFSDLLSEVFGRGTLPSPPEIDRVR